MSVSSRVLVRMVGGTYKDFLTFKLVFSSGNIQCYRKHIFHQVTSIYFIELSEETIQSEHKLSRLFRLILFSLTVQLIRVFNSF